MSKNVERIMEWIDAKEMPADELVLLAAAILNSVGPTAAQADAFADALDPSTFSEIYCAFDARGEGGDEDDEDDEDDVNVEA